MSYSAEISRSDPTCFLFLIDQSSSMLEPFGRQPDRNKADGVADAINRLLQNLVIKCAKSEGIRDYFHVGVIGYGGPAKPALGGPLAGKTLVPISLLADHPIRVEERKRLVLDGTGGLVDQAVKFPVWIEAKASGRTPMCQALNLAKEVLTAFVDEHPKSYPPLVINITDGMATDGNPLEPSIELRRLMTEDGNLLLLNAHIAPSKADPVEFPFRETQLPDDKFAKLLFRMSSMLPPRLREAARGEGFDLNSQTRGFVFNADMVSVVRFLDIGTRVSQRSTEHAHENA